MLPVAILAGGLATRLRPATEKIPKSLLEVNGEPFIAHQLRLLFKAGGVSTGGVVRGIFGRDGSRCRYRMGMRLDGMCTIRLTGLPSWEPRAR